MTFQEQAFAATWATRTLSPLGLDPWALRHLSSSCKCGYEPADLGRRGLDHMTYHIVMAILFRARATINFDWDCAVLRGPWVDRAAAMGQEARRAHDRCVGATISYRGSCCPYGAITPYLCGWVFRPDPEPFTSHRGWHYARVVERWTP